MTCDICKESATILAHQIRGLITVEACLDCADRHYQDQLTKALIAKAVA